MNMVVSGSLCAHHEHLEQNTAEPDTTMFIKGYQTARLWSCGCLDGVIPEPGYGADGAPGAHADRTGGSALIGSSAKCQGRGVGRKPYQRGTPVPVPERCSV